MNVPADTIKKFVIYSIVCHAGILLVWGSVVVHRSAPVYGDHIEVSLKRFEFEKPQPAKKPVRKKAVEKKEKKVVEKVEKRDKSISLDKKKSSEASEESAEAAPDSEARPSYGFTPRPGYPAVAIRRGYEGTVVLRVRVLADGSPAEVTVFRSSGHRILDKAAVKAVRRWKFVPAQRGFRTVASTVKVPIEFRLN